MSIRKALPALTLAAAIALTATACGTTGTSDDNKPAPATSAPQPADALETPAAEDKADDKAEDGPLVKAFGESFTWDDGLTVSLSQPTGYAPGEYAAGIEGFASFIITTVTITNGSEAAYDPTMFTVKGTSGNAPVSEVFDSGNATPVGGTQFGMSAVLPGQTVTFPMAFGVQNTADVTLEVAPGWTEDMATQYTPGYFQGAAA